MPFGEEIAAMAETHRTPGDKYGVGDNVRQKFTGYERDEETGLDFAEARYYYNNHGRFTAVDPLLASGKSADPQTFNRYAYTMNRPLVLTDPTGLQTGETAPPQKAPTTDSDRLTPPAIDIGKDLPKGRNEWQIRVVDKQAIALNGEDIRDSEGKIVEENGKVFKNQNAILARITYAVTPPANISEFGEVTAITMKERITDETLNGKRQADYERSIPLTKDGESGVWLGSDLVGISSDAPNKPTSILKGTQTL